MPVPLNALALTQPIDPADTVEFVVTLSQGAADALPAPFLLTGESVASFTLTASAEAAALGVSVRQDGAYAPTISANKLTFWPAVASGQQLASAFTPGTVVGIEFTATTNSSPARTKQRTIALTVGQQ